MSTATIIASVITGGTNSHQTVAEELNAYATDFVSQGLIGTIGANVGSGGTGPYCVNADSSPDMGVTVLPGVAYVAGTPTGQDAQVIRARQTATTTAYAISANASGSTKYDWIYLSLNPTNASTPDSAADNVINLYTSRSTSNSADNGSPPTYGLLLAIVTVANGASSITNSNISDQRTSATFGGASGGKISAAALYNPYKFSVYRNTAWTPSTSVSAVPFDSKNYDTDTNVDVVTHQGRFTAPAAGFYHFDAIISMTFVSGVGVTIYLYKNGSPITTGNSWIDYTTNSWQNGLKVGGDLQLAASDYIEVWVIGSGGTGATGINSTFTGYLISTT